MKRVILAILLVMLCYSPSFGDCGMGPGPGVKSYAGGAASCNYDACAAGCTLFRWDCSTATMGSNVCSLGDTSGTLTGEADLTTNAGKITLVDTSNNGSDFYSYSVSSYDIFPSGAFTLEMTINMSVVNTTSRIFTVSFDLNNYLIIDFICTSGNDIRIQHKGNGTAESNTFNTNLNTGTEYQLVITGDTVTGMDISIDGGSTWIGVPASSTITTMTHAGTGTNILTIGNNSANNTEGTIDNVRIKSGYKAGY